MGELTTSDIRPEEAQKRYFELYREEINNLLDHNTGLIKKELLTERVCPVCNSLSYQREFVKDGFIYVKCKDCGLLFVNPSLKDEALKNYYENSKAMDFFQEYILMPTRKVRNERIFMPRVRLVEKHCTGGKLLDVGCAIGNFLECLKDNTSWQISGVEPSIVASDYVNKVLGIPVANCLLEDTVYPENSFDVITFWETVEHLQAPAEVLKYCYKLMKKGGVFFISTPNIDGFEFLVGGKDHVNIGAPQHLNYFSPKTLGQILTKAGFSSIEITTPGKIDVENVRLLLREGIGMDVAGSFLADIILGDGEEHNVLRGAFQKFIRENNFSGNMVAVCRKA